MRRQFSLHVRHLIPYLASPWIKRVEVNLWNFEDCGEDPVTLFSFRLESPGCSPLFFGPHPSLPHVTYFKLSSLRYRPENQK